MFLDHVITFIGRLTSPAAVLGIGFIALAASGAATAEAMASAPVGSYGNSTPAFLPGHP